MLFITRARDTAGWRDATSGEINRGSSRHRSHRDSARTSRSRGEQSLCPPARLHSLSPVRLSSAPSRSLPGKKGTRAAGGAGPSPELCGPTAPLTRSRLQRKTPPRLRSCRYLVQLHFFQPGRSSLHARASPKHPPSEQSLQEAPGRRWDTILGYSWGPDLPGSNYTTEDRLSPTLKQN